MSDPKVARYAMTADDGFVDVEVTDRGPWVRHSDYARLAGELAEVKKPDHGRDLYMGLCRTLISRILEASPETDPLSDIGLRLEALIRQRDSLKAERDRLKEEMSDCHAMLKAPSFDNDGGPTDLRDEIRTLLHNSNVWAEDASKAEAERDGLREALARICDYSTDWTISTDSNVVAVQDIAWKALAGGGDEGE